MKHYCNRRTPVRGTQKNNPPENYVPVFNSAEKPEEEKSKSNESEEEIVLPPGCDGSMFEELGKKVITYNERRGTVETDYTNAQGGSVTQCGGLENAEDCYYMLQNEPQPIYADDLSGRFGMMSVAAEAEEAPIRSMSEYLSKYKGKFLCLDLWTSDMRRMEKCGILSETGRDFIVIQTEIRGELMMIDLKTVRYISIYCR